MKAWDVQENLSGTQRVPHTRYPVEQPTEIVMTQDLQEALDLLESLHGRTPAEADQKSHLWSVRGVAIQ